MKEKVPVQKGPIKVDCDTYKNSTYDKRVKDRKQEITELRSGRNMSMPKSKKS